MLYYRYRPAVETSFKELLYSEMYFCSPEECNDPFDSKGYFEFRADASKWCSLLRFASQRFGSLASPNLIEHIANHIVAGCPLTFDEALSRDLVAEAAEPGSGVMPVGVLSHALRNTLDLYRPRTSYFVSFSRTATEPLLWSHYADRHRGFCLIFRAIQAHLWQRRASMRTSVRRNNPRGLAPLMIQSVPESFPFEDIQYQPGVELLDAFRCFPEEISGTKMSDEDRMNLYVEHNRHYMHKHSGWNYEEETRVILKAPLPWLLGGHAELSPQERLLHFEPSQLVGVVLGARMTPDARQRVLEVVETRQEWLARSLPGNGKTIVWDLAILHAELSTRQRGIELVADKLYSLSKCIDAGEARFEERYGKWKQGWAVEFEGAKASNVRVD